MSHSEKCHVTDQGVKQLIELHQLQELRLGSATDNKFTEEGFNTVVKALQQLPELAVLEMQLPAVK